MAHYKKLPVVIEAEQFVGIDSPKDIGGILVQSHVKRYSLSTDHCVFCNTPFSKHGSVETSDGEYIVCPNDFIIKDMSGEFYPCKPEIFKLKYEDV